MKFSNFNLIAIVTTILVMLGPTRTLGQSTEQGFFVFDSERLHMAQILSHPALTIDHLDENGYEVYGPPGLETWLDNLGVQIFELDEMVNKDAFADYPTPEEITAHLKNIAAKNPDIIQLTSLGKSHEGRDIWSVKLSDNVTMDEVEPEVKYIANMHGNEIVGRELMVKLIEDLVASYRSGESEVVELINNSEVFIVPTMNPDGSLMRRRGNSRWTDLNRNFPDFTTRDNQNDPTGRELETKAVMAFQAARKFSLSANFHGGTMCVNYPWDTSPETAPYNNLIIELSKEYASRVPGMFDSNQFPDGIVNGYSWYEVNGGMQDWSYHWYGDLQVTIELSHQKWPEYSTIDEFYRGNRWSLIRYLNRVHQGAGFKFDDPTVEGVVNISRLSAEGATELGQHGFGDGEYYKVLPEGVYRFHVTNDRGLDKTFTTTVNFLNRKTNGNYTELSLND